jgi:hypothetical protein
MLWQAITRSVVLSRANDAMAVELIIVYGMRLDPTGNSP